MYNRMAYEWLFNDGVLRDDSDTGEKSNFSEKRL